MAERERDKVSDVPQKEALYNPVLKAFRDLGGSATMSELSVHIIRSMRLRDDILDELLPGGSEPRLQNRISWARNELKHCGYVENVSRGVWVLTKHGQETAEVDPTVVHRRAVEVVQGNKRTGQEDSDPSENEPDTGEYDEESAWRGHLRSLLLAMDPTAFERLCGTVLRRSGFTNTYETPKSRDGGVDGRGLLKLEGMISIPVAFQCKRYAGSVSAVEVQRLRGALRGQERGLFFTTGSFTGPAKREALEGDKVIDLIDGEDLLDLLRKLELGVKEFTQTTVDTNWWESNYGVSLENGSDEGDE